MLRIAGGVMRQRKFLTLVGSAATWPLKQPNKYDLVIGARAAKVIGLTLPPTLLVRGDEVIE
jgi:hypothetical protein